MSARPEAPATDGTGPLDDLVHKAVVAADTGVSAEGVGAIVRDHAPLLADADVAATVRRVQARMHGLGLLDEVLADDGVTDVMVNGPGTVWVEKDGRVARSHVSLDRPAVDHLVERVVAPLGLRADRRSPLVDARLPDGSRVHIAMPPLAVDGPYVTVRRFGARTLPLTSFASDEVADLLVDAVRRRRNLIVSGGTGAGKTTLLNALCQYLDPGERVVTIEDAAELRLPGDHVVRLETRPANSDGLSAVSIRELLRNALRMRPDRIVIGEVRSGEAFDLVQAMNTGHDGSLSTCHANGPEEALRRLETMALTAGVDLPLAALRPQLDTAIDMIVQVARTREGSRAITDIHEVTGDHGSGRRTRPVVEAGQRLGGRR